MKYYIVTLLLVLFSLPSFVLAEVINEFKVEYQINTDGTVLVKEQIIYDFESSERRGIFRTLENYHPQGATAWYKSREVEIELLAVERDGREEMVSVTKGSDYVEYRIGNPSVTITGQHTYDIEYLLTGALSYGTEGAEFYWNVTGNDWPVAINNVSATVSGPQTGTLACYQGYFGATDSCLTEYSEDLAFFSTPSLNSGAGLTIATEVDQSRVATLVTEKVNYLPFGFVAGFLWIVYFIRAVYKHRTRDKKDQTVIAQYEPIAGYLPMYTGVIYDGNLDPKDITAGIVYMAEQGFIKIKRTEKKVLLLFTVNDYEITLLRPLEELPNKFLKSLSKLLFSSGTAVGTITLLSNLSKNRVANSRVILSLKSALQEDLKSTGLTTNKLPPWSTGKTILLILLIVFFGAFLWVENGIVLVFLVGFVTFFVGIIALVDRFTARGHELKNHLEGFKLFLSVTDKERFDFHNAPEKSPELFMKYLPYAIALGVEEKWAKVFEDITIPQPDWYEGGSIGAFSATAFTSDISAFSSSFSASSGTSGSSGGGSSGGGGGGGGGGSW